MLYVVQNGMQAQAKRKSRLGKDEFIRMAEEIAASTRGRPV